MQKNSLLVVVISLILLGITPDGPALGASCKSMFNQVTFNTPSEISMFACVAKDKFMGTQEVAWNIKNNTADRIDVKFTKVYHLSCGVTERVEVSGLSPIIDAGKSEGDGSFADLLRDDIFVSDKCGKGAHLSSIAYENLRIINLSAQEREAERKKQEAERKRQEEERKRQEAERKKQEEENIRIAAAKKEEEHRAEQVRQQKQEERKVKEQADREQKERDRQAREEEERERRAELKRQELERRAEASRQYHTEVERQHRETESSVTAAGMGALGQKVLFSGATWHTRLGVGMGGVSFPIFAEAIGQVQNGHISTSSSANSYGMSLLTELWPYVSDHCGVGGVFNYTYGLFSSSDTSFSGNAMSLMYGAKGYVGFSALSLLLEYDIIKREGSSSSDLAVFGVDYSSTGSASADSTRFGVGARLGSVLENSEHSGTYLDILYFMNTPKTKPFFTKEKAKTPVYRLEGGIGPVVLYGEYGPKYPISGRPELPGTYTDSKTGTYWSLGFAFMYRWFGEPYFR